MRWLRNGPLAQIVALAALTACGVSEPTSAVSPSPPVREMHIVMAGALNGSFELISQYNACATHLADDPRSVNYILQGYVGETTNDYSSTGLNFAVRRYTKPGTFPVGPYPTGSQTSPAIASLVREITPQNIVTWISGSGSLVVDVGARSGTLDLRLTSTSGLGDLSVSGPWVCPAGT